MADCKEKCFTDSSCSLEFIQELLLSAQRTSLLYHLSYLCLGKFPNLERLIRKRAVETQLLFGSSEAFLMKCVGTSDNLVTFLLPSLKLCVEKNKPGLALKHLEKAKEWIGEIIIDVKEIVKRYDEHNRDVATTTSDVITKKEKTDKKQQEQTSEMEELQKIVDGLEEKLHNSSHKIEEYEKKIEEKNTVIQTFISSITSTNKQEMMMMGFMFAIMPPELLILPVIIGTVYKTMKSISEKDQLTALHAELSELTEAQKRLKEQEWGIQVKLMDNQMKLSKLKIENGQIPSVTHLDEVQQCLSRIQQILVQLQKFWEKVCSLLDKLKKRTLAGEILIEDLDDMKEMFLESIDAAKEGWTQFAISCMKASKIFSVQANDAYRFLEISPSSLSEEAWQKEYDSVKEKLEKIRSNAGKPAAII